MKDVLLAFLRNKLLDLDQTQTGQIQVRPANLGNNCFGDRLVQTTGCLPPMASAGMAVPAAPPRWGRFFCTASDLALRKPPSVTGLFVGPLNSALRPPLLIAFKSGMSAKHHHKSERNPIPSVGHAARSLSVKGFTIKQFRKRIKNSGSDPLRTITVFQPHPLTSS